MIAIVKRPILYHKGSGKWASDGKHTLQSEKLEYPRVVGKESTAFIVATGFFDCCSPRPTTVHYIAAAATKIRCAPL